MMPWFNRLMGWDVIDETAAVMVDVFIRHVSIHQCTKERLVNKAFSAILAQATGEKRRREWRGYATARVANTFGWKLVERGYPEEVALSLAKKLAVQLAQKK